MQAGTQSKIQSCLETTVQVHKSSHWTDKTYWTNYNIIVLFSFYLIFLLYPLLLVFHCHQSQWTSEYDFLVPVGFWGFFCHHNFIPNRSCLSPFFLFWSTVLFCWRQALGVCIHLFHRGPRSAVDRCSDAIKENTALDTREKWRCVCICLCVCTACV